MARVHRCAHGVLLHPIHGALPTVSQPPVPSLHHAYAHLSNSYNPMPTFHALRPTARDVRLREEELPELPASPTAPRAPKAPRHSDAKPYAYAAAAAARAPTALGATAAPSGVSRGTWQDLTLQHLHLIASSDTFFIATCYQPPPGRAGGVPEVRG